MASTKGTTILSSSAADEESYEKSPDPKLSLFTFHLIQALRGAPEALDEQLLTVPKLYDYVSTRVRRDSKSYRRKQTPSFSTSATGIFVLGDFRLREAGKSLAADTSTLTPNTTTAEPHEAPKSAVVSAAATALSSDVLTSLKEAASHVALQDQQLQARASALEARRQEAKLGFARLAENVERLWAKLHSQVPQVHRASGNAVGVVQFQLGNGWLVTNLNASNFVEAGYFPLSGWDVVANSQIIANQTQPSYSWSSSLWLLKRKGESNYRWYEASYWHAVARDFEPYAEYPGEDADCAAANVFGRANFAFGPCLIDGECENEFHDRWIWLLSKAAQGKLRRPAHMPFDWPPSL
ncbi:MAG TPA: hypothetical protein VFZ59_04830 [Verrucomicrobiae bacterium]|nr:hypothetical protein [Verrucomicrobiae bacterium]